MIRRLAPLTICMIPALPVVAKETPAVENYVQANLIAILYHELGHALIDIMALPVFGQEEDAADTASILLIDALYRNDTATDIARDAAFGFLDEAVATSETPAWWDVHGPDLQRYYNLVCLFYGADPDHRNDIADELDLPSDRAESCEEEFDLAYSSWGPVLDELEDARAGDSIKYLGGTISFTEQLISDKIAALNAEFSLPKELKVEVTSCGEANAFYDPNAISVTICTEFEPHLRNLFSEN